MTDSAPVDPSPALERLDANERQDHVATQHWARYEWAARFVAGRRVLDCACGVGYGSATLKARGAAEVIGADVSEEAVAVAQERYAADGLRFIHCNACDLNPDQLGLFDVVVSLETIEHIADPQPALDAFKRMLKPDGVLLLSVPNEKPAETLNPFHAWTAEYDEVHAWLAARFDCVRSAAEVHVIGTSIVDADLLRRPRADDLQRDVVVRLVDAAELRSAAGFLFACSDAELAPSAGAGSLQLNGMEYYRGLENAVNRLWAESRTFVEERNSYFGEAQKLGAAWEEHSAFIREQAQRIAELETELAKLRSNDDVGGA